MQGKIKYIITTLFILVLQTNTSRCIAQQSNSKDTSINIYYNSQLQVLNPKDSNTASYFRVVKYRNGNVFGTVNDFYKDGSILMTGHYSGNILIDEYKNGRFTYYFKNGFFFQICNYINGLLDGPYIEFDSTGNPKACVTYSKGIKNGCEYLWDEKGKLIQKDFVENGALYDRAECNETAIEKIITKEKKLSFDGWNLTNFRTKDYTIDDDSIFIYLTNIAQISEVSTTEMDANVGAFCLSPTFKIEGFKRNDGKYSFTYWVATDFEDGKNFQIIDYKKSSSEKYPFYFSFIYNKPPPSKTGQSTNLVVTLLIKDNNSEAVIFGRYLDGDFEK